MQPAGSEQTDPGGGPPPPRRRRTGRIVALIVVLSLVVLGTLVGVGTWAVLRIVGNPQNAASTFFTALEQERYDTAAFMLCGPLADDGETRLREVFAAPVHDWHSTWSSRSGDTATVVGDLTIGSASAFPITVQLVKEDGDWKICSLPS